MDELEQIRQKIDIVSLISEYLPLKKTGRNFRVNCPFHNEKTPSFTVSPERQIFHCFGCSVGGDIFTFLMKYENLEFPEALRTLAQKAGVELKKRDFDSEGSKIKQKLYEINHLASEFYHYLLTSHTVGKKALDYLGQRGISQGAIKTFKLGFSPSAANSLTKFLVNKKKYTMRDLDQAGLVIGGRDRFRSRIIFPLKDHRGNIVGFAGRTLEEAHSASSVQAKYVNTPETLIYHKGDLFFGLDLAREAIKKEDSVVIAEGEFDVIQGFQHGIGNMVAIKGTALTQNQANLISRFTENISLCLDQDKAGELANLRGIEILENANLQVKVVEMPSGKDPDESLKENPALFKQAVKKSLSMYDFIIKSALSHFDRTEAGGKKKVSEQVVPFLGRIRNEIVKNHYIKKLSEELSVSEESVAREVARQDKNQQLIAQPAALADKRKREEVLLEYLLALVLQHPTPQVLLEKLDEDITTSSLYQKIIKELKRFWEKDKDRKFSIKDLVAALPAELVPAVDRSFLLMLPSKLDLAGEYLAEVEKIVRELKKLLLKEKMQELSSKIRQAEKDKNESELEVLRKTFGELASQLSIYSLA
ncbi:DNA primase [Candidatus Microgenomates bacterium]|nr:DNA primase [Candidatus Microgenomates bacterium]